MTNFISDDELGMQNKKALVIEVERMPRFPELFLDLFQFEAVRQIYLRDVTSSLNTDMYDFVLYSCDCVNERQLRWILPFANRNPKSQFVILTHQISIHAYQQVAEMGNLITLQLPLGEEIMKAMIKQMVNDESVIANQRFPRFITDEPVRMVVMETGLLIPSRMKNYSVSGAFIEYKGIHLRVGHTLKVNMPKQENPSTKKKLQLDGRIVWVRGGEGKVGASNGIGVQFTRFVTLAA